MATTPCAGEPGPESPAHPGRCDPIVSVKRTKAGRLISSITVEEVQSCFDLPSEAACKKLGVGGTMLKRICRRFGITQWPYQRVYQRRGGSLLPSSPPKQLPRHSDGTPRAPRLAAAAALAELRSGSEHSGSMQRLSPPATPLADRLARVPSGNSPSCSHAAQPRFGQRSLPPPSLPQLHWRDLLSPLVAQAHAQPLPQLQAPLLPPAPPQAPPLLPPAAGAGLLDQLLPQLGRSSNSVGGGQGGELDQALDLLQALLGEQGGCAGAAATEPLPSLSTLLQHLGIGVLQQLQALVELVAPEGPAPGAAGAWQAPLPSPQQLTPQQFSPLPACGPSPRQHPLLPLLQAGGFFG